MKLFKTDAAKAAVADKRVDVKVSVAGLLTDDEFAAKRAEVIGRI